MEKMSAFAKSQNFQALKFEASLWQIQVVNFRVNCKNVLEKASKEGIKSPIQNYNIAERALVKQGFLKSSSI